jgi:hypothetical protein
VVHGDEAFEGEDEAQATVTLLIGLYKRGQSLPCGGRGGSGKKYKRFGAKSL